MQICDSNRHYYDASKDSQCPHCAEEFGVEDSVKSNDGAHTEALGGSPFTEKKGKTEVNRKTFKIDEERKKSLDITIEPEVITAGGRTQPKDNRTRILGTDGVEIAGMLPVAGWVVICEGDGLGTDYRIIQGENRIGRDKGMEVCLTNGDETVSRDAHAVIVHDTRNGSFFIERGSSRNLPLVNGQTVRRDMDLNAGDIIQIGNTKMSFVPFVTPTIDSPEKD